MISFSSEIWGQSPNAFGNEFPYIEISAIDLQSGEYEVNKVLLNEAPSRAKMIVRDSDVIVSMTRPNRGAIAKIKAEHDGYIASTGFAIIREIKETIDRDYLYYAIRSSFALNQFLQRSSGGNYPAITQDEIEKVVIPLPSLGTQRTLVADMESAHLARREKLSQADALLQGIDGFVLEQLKLETPKEVTRKSFAVRLQQLQTSQIMNADYFHPERMEALKVIQKSSPRLRVERLADIADFLRDITTVQKEDNYLGLASIQSNTGELIQVEEAADGQCFRYLKNDVLFGRLRPYLNKIRCAEENGVCSTEFHVIRLMKEDKSKEEIFPEYLAVILRSSLILAQTKHMMTGNTHPRLTNEDVVNLVVPIPQDINLQKKIVSELQRRRHQARVLREEAEREWQNAKEKFEKTLLG